jgi:hypothetical protein
MAKSLLLMAGLWTLAGAPGAADTKDAREVKGKVVKVEAAQKTLTVLTAAGKKDFLIGNDTKVLDPKGAVSKDGLLDRRLVPGAEVRLVLAQDGKTVKEIHFLVAEAKGQRGDTGWEGR